MKNILLAFAAWAVFMSCGGDDKASSNPQGGNGNTEGGGTGTTETGWSAAADSCTFVLIDQFLNKTKGTFWGSAKNALQNSSVLYWQQAHAMDVLVYSYERIKKSNPTLAATYENYFKLWYKNHANNWYGWQGKGDTTGFLNEYTDDMCWIALTLLHMTEATGDETYYNTAKKVYDDYIIKRGWVDDKGLFGLPWKSTADGQGRNACTNTPGCAVACKLYLKTSEQKYLDDAKKIYDYILGNLMKADGRVEEPPLTYTQGTFTEAARLLYHITGEKSYMQKAELAAIYAFTSNRCTTNGLLRSEGNSQDQSIFKAVLIPYAVNLALDSEASVYTREQLKLYLEKNAKSMWYSHVDRDAYPRMFCNFYWGATYPTSTAAEYSGSLGAQTSGASLLEGVARLTKE